MAFLLDGLKSLASELIDDLESFADLTQVAVVSADACASVLSRRLSAGSIYTHCGPLLVAVNPYQDLPQMYAPEVLERYRQYQMGDQHAPHIFGVAAYVYKRAMSSGMDQAIIVSGESGAGKTETTKHILQFVAETTHSARARLHERVLETNPIMESFGCAQTTRNDNRHARMHRVLSALPTSTRDSRMVLACAQLALWQVRPNGVFPHWPT